ncbi:hypothetical protein N7G274_007597 [Stereocaulon virgatum]|uniref:NAD(P)-binding protein n=1 Tax=Stereocaulon virgatum TaxID=373712 RepID=A0ABR4A3W7_9LECA
MASSSAASAATKYISKLHNQRVLVVGGTSGIGFCVASALLEHGAARVCISGSKPAKLEHALARLRTSYPDKSARIFGSVCDLSQPQHLEARVQQLLAYAATTEAGGKVDGEVDGDEAEGNDNKKIDHIAVTAGDGIKITPIAEVTVEEVLRLGNVRFLGALMLAKHAPRYMAPGPRSSITLTGGTMTHKPKKNWTVIAGWSGAMEGIARGLAVDLAPIRVNLVSPGAVHTELFDDIPKDNLDGVLRGFRDDSLIDRVGTPQNLAEAYLYMMKNEFTTGTILPSDGGRLVKP